MTLPRGRAGAVAALAAALAILPAPRPAAARDELEIAVHHAYGTPRSFTIEGRVAERRPGRAARADDSALRNLWRNLRRLVSDEADGVALRADVGGALFEARTDREGYFVIEGATPAALGSGWRAVRVETADGRVRTEADLLVVPPENGIGIISDVDDTVVVSEVPDRSRLLRHVLLENHLQREAVPGMAALYRTIAARNPRPEAAPVVYLTASPRQLVPEIRAFLDLQGFPRGPVVAKVVSDRGGDPLLDQERYKTGRIEQLLADLAPARFVLAGDDGERDPEVYRGVRERHPERIEAVWIRRVSPEPGRARYPGQTPPPLGENAPP